MLDNILRVVKPGTPRPLPNWQRFVAIVKLRTEILRTRYIRSPFMHNYTTNLFDTILKRIDIPAMDACSSDYTRYSQVVEPLSRALRGLYDPVFGGSSAYGKFNMDKRIPEYLLNVAMASPMTTMPLDREWSAWTATQPVRIVYHDTLELVTNLTQYRVPFAYTAPTVTIYSIDPVLLFFKYYKYTKHCQELGTVVDNDDFIKFHIMLPWFDDLRNIWLFNIVSSVFAGTFSIDNIHADPTIQIATTLRSVYTDLKRLQNDMEKKAISVGDMLSTMWYGDKSIYDNMVLYSTQTCLPQLRQYTAMEFMGFLAYSKFIIDATNQIDRVDSRVLNRELIYMLNRYKLMGLTGSLHPIELRTKIDAEIDGILLSSKKHEGWV